MASTPAPDEHARPQAEAHGAPEVTRPRRPGLVDALVCAGTAVAFGLWAGYPAGWCVLVGLGGPIIGVFGGGLLRVGVGRLRLAVVLAAIALCVAAPLLFKQRPTHLVPGGRAIYAGQRLAWINYQTIGLVSWGAIVKQVPVTGGFEWISDDGETLVTFRLNPVGVSLRVSSVGMRDVMLHFASGTEESWRHLIRERDDGAIAILSVSWQTWPEEPLQQRLSIVNAGATTRLDYEGSPDIVGFAPDGREVLVWEQGEFRLHPADVADLTKGNSPPIKHHLVSLRFEEVRIDQSGSRLCFVRSDALKVPYTFTEVATGLVRGQPSGDWVVVSPDGSRHATAKPDQSITVIDPFSNHGLGYGMASRPRRTFSYLLAMAALGVLLGAAVLRTTDRWRATGACIAAALLATTAASALHAVRTPGWLLTPAALAVGAVLAILIGIHICRRQRLAGPWLGLAAAQAVVLVVLGWLEVVATS